MAGQGRNADGLTGSRPGEAPNVVRFPGDWFGPLEDLVPIGKDAGTELDAQGSSLDEPDAVGADSFWSEDAQDVHRVATPAHDVNVAMGPASGARASGGRASGGRVGMSPPGSAPSRPRRRRLRLTALVAGFTAMAALAIVLVTPMAGSGPPTAESRVALNHRDARSTAGNLAAAAPRVTGSSRTSRSAKTDAPAHKRDDRARAARHPTRHRTPASARTRPHPEAAVTKVSTGAGVEGATGAIPSPTGVVSPAPNATQLNP